MLAGIRQGVDARSVVSFALFDVVIAIVLRTSCFVLFDVCYAECLCVLPRLISTLIIICKQWLILAICLLHTFLFTLDHCESKMVYLKQIE